MQPNAVFFDMDFTLLAVDCELTWKNLLVDHGFCGAEERALAQHYIELHDAGQTPRDEYLQFMLRDFVQRTPEELKPLARENFEKQIRHEIYADGLKAIAKYRERGIPTVLLSGSNRLIVEPIAEYIGITDVICTELEVRAGRFTGNVDGLYRIQEHKVSGAIDWCHARDTTPSRVAFYGDSKSDIPMFEVVGQPHVVNPGDSLATLASNRGWEVLRWKSKGSGP